MVEDISKKTILILVILTVVVSVLGVLTIFDAVNAQDIAKEAYVSEYTNIQDEGQVSLTISDKIPKINVSTTS